MEGRECPSSKAHWWYVVDFFNVLVCGLAWLTRFITYIHTTFNFLPISHLFTGAINFVAVSETLGVSGSAISAAVAADNVVIALYFAMLFTLAKSGEKEVESDGDSSNGANVEIDVRDPEDVTNDGDGTGITMPSLAIAMAVACCLVTIGKIMTKAFFPTTSVSVNTRNECKQIVSCAPQLRHVVHSL